MNLLPLPWLKLAVVVPLLGALWVSRLRDPYAAHRWGLLFTGASLACAVLASLAFYYPPPAGADPGDLIPEANRDRLKSIAVVVTQMMIDGEQDLDVGVIDHPRQFARLVVGMAQAMQADGRARAFQAW